MRCSVTVTGTGLPVSRADIAPVDTEFFACASSVALRPSQPKVAPVSICPIPISGCDLREVSLPESLRLRASVPAQARSGR